MPSAISAGQKLIAPLAKEDGFVFWRDRWPESAWGLAFVLLRIFSPKRKKKSWKRFIVRYAIAVIASEITKIEPTVNTVVAQCISIPVGRDRLAGGFGT